MALLQKQSHDLQQLINRDVSFLRRQFAQPVQQFPIHSYPRDSLTHAMKTRPILLLLCLCLCLHSTVHAALALYNGTGKATFYGNSQTIKGTGKEYLVLDTDTLDAYEIVGTVFGGTKTYTVRHLNNFRIGTVNAGPAVYAYLARAGDDGVTLESVCLKGKNTLVTLDRSGQSYFVPRAIAGPSRLLAGGLLGEIDEAFTIDVRNSTLSNDASFSIQTVVTAAQLTFERLGYSPNPGSP